ncbi:DUF3144 domain-containing protein [Pseudomonadota bacterium]
MGEENNGLTMYDLANKYIDLANELSKVDQSGNVGVALRYSAARYSAFEASIRTESLADDKEQILDKYMEDYRKMLSDNIDEYIKQSAN